MSTTRLKPVIPASRVEAAVQSLSDYISRNAVPVGARLPAERELAASLGLSRPTVREALRHLAALGVVGSKTGSGTYLLRSLSPSNHYLVVSFEAERQNLLQALELRRALEAEAAALVASRASPAEIAHLGQLVEVLEEEFSQKGDNPESDKAFHLALYRYCGNPLFLQLLQSVWDVLERFWARPLGKANFARRTLPLHRVIYERIHARDPAGARQAVWEMLRIVEEDLRA